MFDIEKNAAALFLNSLTEDAAYNGVTEATACLTHLLGGQSVDTDLVLPSQN